MSQPPDLFATLIPYPEPAAAEAVAATNPTAARLLTNWRTHIPAHPEDGTGDFEDYWEMAARLTAALESGAAKVWAHLSTEDEARLLVNTVPDDCPGPVPVEHLHRRLEMGEAVHYGPITRGSVLNFQLDGRADAYPHTGVFRAHAGRAVLIAGYLPEPEEHPDATRIEDALAQMAHEGHHEVVVKTVRAKHGIWRLPASTDTTINTRVLSDALGWSLVHLEGRPASLSVQQVVEMTYEYRVFIVDGEPVTGAGCIEEHTPLDTDASAAFSPLVRCRRPIYLPASEADLESRLDARAAGAEARSSAAASTDPVESRPDLVEVYLAFARQVATHAAIEESMPDAYVLDCALVEGQPVVIEMNGLTNSGLYASQPWLVTRALVHRP